MKTVPVTGLTWDQVRDAVRAYARDRGLEALPDYRIPLADGCIDPLRVYTPGAAIDIVTFRPFFRDDGRTLLHVRGVYTGGYGAEALLEYLGADLSQAS